MIQAKIEQMDKLESSNTKLKNKRKHISSKTCIVLNRKLKEKHPGDI